MQISNDTDNLVIDGVSYNSSDTKLVQYTGPKSTILFSYRNNSDSAFKLGWYCDSYTVPSNNLVIKSFAKFYEEFEISFDVTLVAGDDNKNVTILTRDGHTVRFFFNSHPPAGKKPGWLNNRKLPVGG